MNFPIIKKSWKKMYHGLHQNTVFNIDYKKTDTEVWSNDAENSALHHRNKLHFRIKVFF